MAPQGLVVAGRRIPAGSLGTITVSGGINMGLSGYIWPAGPDWVRVTANPNPEDPGSSLTIRRSLVTRVI
jgi:hypothetical protein